MGSVLITGAAGGIGSALVAELVGAGHEVTGLSRDQAGLGRTEAMGAHGVVADLGDPAGLAASLAVALRALAARQARLAEPVEVAAPVQGAGAVGSHRLPGSHRH